MLAAVFSERGKPLQLQEVSDPLNPIRVGATGLCHGDVHIIMGDWGWDVNVSPPLILGHEIALVDDQGNTHLLYNSKGCGVCKQCRSGFPQYCERLKVIGVHVNGGFANYMEKPEGYPLVPVKGNPADVAPLADAGTTAVNSVEGISEGDVVAVLGTGEVALLSIQLLKLVGAETWVVGRNQSKLRKARELGADEVIFSKGQYSSSLSESAGLKKFDYILDYVGSDESLRDVPWLLRRTGELRIIGEFGGELRIPEQLLVLRGLRVKGILYGSLSHMKEAVRIYEKGMLKTLSVPYSLSEINQAISDLLEGKVVGRVVIIPSF
ncbi:zinc-binding dehydrogenase [Metallosphaera tengchongensis]|uniref:Zinc-binding dehydrogenase n=1 Tax=Metallosphaera tengchongensis TaxID=1532350 RepID=A0A6N0NV13_9CREN|nr:zinc-binding dehydrogenase [Metallosphaera tengchongensis]QKR00562.1 zinc-binding dehydrogenase [Metallosphaera tengchongensis]